ncbi:MAG: hypothetical protein P4L40_20480 [Terracidiphilus sp.]|nr:hypothetical protein [Terracidiphilus sp.]
MKHDLRSKSVSTKASEAELRVLESRAERAILAEMLAMRAILLNFMLKAGGPVIH